MPWPGRPANAFAFWIQENQSRVPGSSGGSMRLFQVLLGGLLLGNLAAAKVLDQTATVAGMFLQYKVVLPIGYGPSSAYPAVLAFPPGSQTMDMVQFTLLGNWALEAQ